ncbi:MAG: zinc-ribbon domain-containing protein [Candidatus Lokiarchaeota archaeon]|nr:zinc-ribbon domain-containing protein [Candidatus Lokiarchaeota archaeon]
MPVDSIVGQVNYCPDCGSKVVQNSKFCINCGFELRF